jgi:hypothetical protein
VSRDHQQNIAELVVGSKVSAYDLEPATFPQNGAHSKWCTGVKEGHLSHIVRCAKSSAAHSEIMARQIFASLRCGRLNADVDAVEGDNCVVIRVAALHNQYQRYVGIRARWHLQTERLREVRVASLEQRL